MLKNKQNGFGITVWLLLLCLMLVIFGVGYYVYGSNTKNKKSETLTVEQETANKLMPVSPELAFTYQTPEGWTINKIDNSANGYYSEEIIAPGTKLTDGPNGEVLTEGCKIVLSKNAYSQSPKNLTEFKSAESVSNLYGSNKKDVALDSVPALRYDLAYEGPETSNVIFFVNSIQYSISAQQTCDKNNKNSKSFDNFLSTIKFKDS